MKQKGADLHVPPAYPGVVETHQDRSRTEVRYRLYHESFRDFLRQKDEMGDLPVSFSDARMRAAQSFSAELFDGE